MNSLITLVKLYNSTGEEYYLNKAESIADYLISTFYIGDFYGSSITVVPSRNTYTNSKWTLLVGEITIRNIYQVILGLMTLYKVNKNIKYFNNATDLVKTCGCIFNNIKSRVIEGELSSFMQGAVYEYAYCADGNLRWSWSITSSLAADVLAESLY